LLDGNDPETYIRKEAEDRISAGGGLANEGEDIEVIEMPLDQALAGTGQHWQRPDSGWQGRVAGPPPAAALVPHWCAVSS
jgi:hypothetical protein